MAKGKSSKTAAAEVGQTVGPTCTIHPVAGQTHPSTLQGKSTTAGTSEIGITAVAAAGITENPANPAASRGCVGLTPGTGTCAGALVGVVPWGGMSYLTIDHLTETIPTGESTAETDIINLPNKNQSFSPLPSSQQYKPSQ